MLYYTDSEQRWIPNFATTKQNSDKTGYVLADQIAIEQIILEQSEEFKSPLYVSLLILRKCLT